jgi:uncharacterized membrane protein (UPF0127 family)
MLRQARVQNLTRNTVLADRAGLAQSSGERRRGLLHHTELPRGEGLWISPCEAIHTFGMTFAIDVVFLDRGRKVLKIRAAMPPGRIAVCLRAQGVIELPPGTAAETGTLVGDQLEFVTC